MGKKRLDLYLDLDQPINEKELLKLRGLVKKRATHFPLEFVIGKIPFYDLTLKVTPNALLPRQETEILVDLAWKRWSPFFSKGKELWDVATGSGAIGLAFKKKSPEINVFLSDISEKALELAKENAKANWLEVNFLQGDFLIPFAGKKADFFLCNPPYLSEEEYLHLDEEILRFEPKEALVAPNQGLYFYQRLAKELPKHLNPKAKVALEIGFSQKEALFQIFSDKIWVSKEVLPDWAGKDRFFFLEME